MEKEKTCKQGRKKTQIGSNGGGNVGGLLLLGGALAVGSLAATLVAHKGNKKRKSNEKRSSSRPKEEKPTQGLHFLLQTSSPFHANPCCVSDGSTEKVTTQIEPSELVSTHSLISEENPSATKSSHESADSDDQESLFTRDSKQDDNHCCEEFSLPELNNLSFYEPGKDAKNGVSEGTTLTATIKVAEEDPIDIVKTSIEEIKSVQSAEEEDDDDKEEKEQAKEKFLSAVKIKVEKVDETIAERTCAEKTSLNSVEQEDGNKSRKGSPLMEITEVKQEEEAIDNEEANAINAVKVTIAEISLVQSSEEENDEAEKKPAKEKPLPEEKINVEKEEEPVAEKTCEEKISLNSVEEDHGDNNFGEEMNLKNITELKQDRIDDAAEYATDALKMSIEENSSVISTEEAADHDKEKKHSLDAKEDDYNDETSDDEHIFQKSQENIRTSSPGLDADEIWPAETVETVSEDQLNTMINSPLSAAKITEQDENNKTEEFNYFSSKNNANDSCRDMNQIKGNTTFTKKEGNPEITVWSKQPTTCLRKWTISIEHMLIMASIVILFLTYCNALSYLSST